MSYKKQTKKFQRPSLLDDIKSILHQYSDDGQIFKEIIQNAEDAGASEVVFILDKNDDRNKILKLSDERLRIHQGPTLYAYNDAKFEESDWDGIRSLRKSNKAKDPLKVGRYGLGFKSVFHLTDIPCVSCGGFFAFLDPLQTTQDEEVTIFELENPSTGSQTYDDFFKLKRLPPPFWNKEMSCSDGTIFQFSLRLKASELSSICYNVNRISKLLTKYIDEAVLTLMFLKNIKSIRIFVIENGTVHLKEIYSCELSSKTRRKYDAYKESFVSSMVSSAKTKKFEIPHCLNHILEIIEKSESGESETYSYAVSEYFGYNGTNEKFLKMIQNEELSYLPLIGVAYPLVDNDDGGHVFSCLPLPLQSKNMNGMPVHVNGYFALGQDRKDLKWKTLSTKESNDITVDWNVNLISELLPTVYYNLIQYLIQERYDEDAVYQAWPTLEKTNHKWRFFLPKFYELMQPSRCIYVTRNAGCWETPNNVYNLDNRKFESNDQLDAVEKFLLQADVKVAKVPSYVFKSIALNTVDKLVVQNVILQKENLYLKLHPLLQSFVCSFILHTYADIRRLEKIHLFPLMNGRYMDIRSDSKTVFLFPTHSHPASILPSNNRVIDPSFFDKNPHLLGRFKEFSKNGQINVRFLESTGDVLDILRLFFKSLYSNRLMFDANRMRWPDSNIPEGWLQDFLDYRRMHRIPLTNLSGIPFILIENCGKFLSMPSTNQKPLLLSYGNQKVSNDMQSFLLSCGVWFVDSTVGAQDVNDFFSAGLVLSPEESNIVRVLKSCEQHLILEKLANTNEELRSELQVAIKSFSRKQQLPDFCNSLPLFKIYGAAKKYGSARSCKVVAVSDLPKEWRSSFADIVLLETIDNKLVSALRMTKWSFQDIALVIINNIDSLNNQQQVSFFAFFLENLKKCNFNQSFCETLKVKIKILDQKKNIKNPKDLFEATAELKHLFYGHQDEYFADTMYNSVVLKMFGLKSKEDISLTDINKCIEYVSYAVKNEEILRKGKDTIIKKVKLIFKILIDKQMNVEELFDLPWIPVSDEPPRGYPDALEWYGQSRNSVELFQKPSEIYPAKYQLYIGSSASICHPSIANDFEVCFKENSLVKCIPEMEVLLSHLKNVEESFDETERRGFTNMIYSVYQYLNFYESKLVEHAKENGMLIWQGWKFVPINQVILSNPSCGSLEPYFYHPPKEVVNSIGKLLREFGCEKNEFNLYVETLQEISKKNDKNYDYTADMRLVFLIVKELARKHAEECIANKEYVFVPVENLQLKLVPLSNCFFHNFEDTTFYTSEKHVLHHELGNDIAEKLQIQTLSCNILTGGEPNIFTPWGQSEPLTLRLQRLLDDYQDGLAIVKEFIQNADDAGATQVKFLYDKRQNKAFNTHLFDPCMKHWQGPALFVYNNAMFSEDDFRNITKISGATKMLDKTKIGKFGLGFNSVYHLTDVPSFLSDTSSVFFDPHQLYLKNILKNQNIPGIRIRLQDDAWEAIGNYQDQFAVFQDIFGVNFDFSKDSFESYRGTLFRLPLRTKETARKSEIKKKPYPNEEMMKLFEKIETSLDTLLLFSENVSSVEVYTLDNMAQSPKEMKLLLSTHKSTTKEGKGVMQLADQELRCLNSDKNYKVRAEKINNSTEMIFHAQIESAKNGGKATSNWIVSTCVGSQRTFQFAAEHKSLIPCGGVAIEIRGNGTTISPMESGQFFCFLPLPIYSILPVHVNGAFEIEKNRKGFMEHNSDEKDFGKEEWNIFLAEDLGNAYYNLIKHLQINFTMSLNTLFACLPHTGGENNPISYALTKSIMKKIINSKIPLFPVENKKIFWHQIKILHVSEEISVASHDFMNLWYQSRDEGFYCLEIPHEFSMLVESCGNVCFLKKAFIQENDVLVTFLQSISKTTLPVVKQNCLINYILEIRKTSEEIGCDLKNMLWVPTLPNDNLKKPCELVKRNSKAGELFTEDDEVFPSVKNRHLSYLEELGMYSDYLSWMMILDRAQSIEKIGPSDVKTAMQRSKKLLYFIRHAKVSCPQDVLKKLCATRFLKVLERPEQCVFKEWHGSKCLFSSPDVMYSKKCCNLVSSTQFVCQEDVPEKQLQLDSRLPTFNTLKLQLVDLVLLHKNKVTRPVFDVLNEIYNFMSENCLPFTDKKIEELSEIECIVTELKTLAKPSKVYVNASCGLSGYISTLNKEVEHLGEFFQSIGVKKECTIKDYAEAMEDMKIAYTGKPLSDPDFKEICKLITHICEDVINQNTTIERPALYLPDISRILQNESVLCYKDFTEEHLEGELYISENLSQQCIKVLNINASSTVKYWNKANEDVNHWIPFGQNEKLTTRIKNILHGYSEPIDIFKEMFQNADDSGASEVHFILDKRHHGDKTIFTENWKHLQGPALLICNNGVFKEEDLKSIQSLGDGSKEEDPLTTGKYGVGFNAVYGITDCPTLLANVQDSGDMMCIFDPNMQYAVGACLEKPGSMVKDARNFLNSYSDVKSSFLLDKFDTSKKTLFRLPLRNEKTAAMSEISKKITSVESIEEQFQEVMKRASEFLLFLLHLKIISFTIIDENGIKTIHKFQGKSYDISEKRLKEFRNFQEDYSRNLGNVISLMNSERRLARSVCVQHFENEKFLDAWHWNVVEQCGFCNMASVDEEIKQLIDDNKLHLIPKGGIAKLSKETCCNVCEELVEEKERGGNDLKKTDEGCIPSDSNSVFCTLPLDVRTGIPVIVNGNFVLEYETRRDLLKSKSNIGYKWNQSIMKSCIVPCYVQYLQRIADELSGRYEVQQKFIGESSLPEASSRKNSSTLSLSSSTSLNINKTCFTDVKSPQMNEVDEIRKKRFQIYAEKQAKLKHDKEIKSYYQLFPVYTDCLDESWKSLVKEFYEQISNKSLLAVHRNREICFCKADGQFLHFFGKEYQSLLDILKSVYLNVDEIPDYISESFKNANLPLKETTPQEVRSRLREQSGLILPSNKETWPVGKTVFANISNVRSVLEYILQTSSEEEKISLKGLPLCVTASGDLQMFSQHCPKYFSLFSDLFKAEKKNLFLNKSLINCMNTFRHNGYKSGELLLFTLQDFSKMLDDSLPNNIKNAENPIEWKSSNDFNEQWIKRFWDCVLSILNENEELYEMSKDTGIVDSQFKDCEAAEKIPLKFQLENVENLSLVLVKRNMSEYLLPIKKSKVVFNINNFHPGLENKKVLIEKIGVFQPKLTFCKSELTGIEIYPSRIIKEIFGSESCENIIDACLFANEHVFIEKLKVDEALNILRLIQQMLPSDINKTLLEKISQLPFFEKCDGTLCDGTGTIVIHPGRVPLDGILAIENASNVKILKDVIDLKKLFDKLEFGRKDENIYYLDNVFPSFDAMENKDAKVHAMYLKNMPEDERILNSLKEVKLLPSENGKRKLCRELFYSNEKVFKLMQTNDDFLKDKEFESMEFLYKLGFNYELNEELILTYARELESEIDVEKFQQVSKLLCEGLFSLIFGDIRGISKYERFLSKLQSIKFLPSLTLFSDKENLEAVYPSRNSKISRMSYSEGVIPSNKNLVWTTEYILPDYAVAKSHKKSKSHKKPKIWETVKGMLKIKSVSDENVVKHVCNIMNAQKNFTNKTNTCKEIKQPYIEVYKKSLKAFYEYLSMKGKDIDPTVVQDISFILVNNSKYVDVPRKSLLLREESISPFLNSVDENLGKYFQVLEKFECCRKPEVFHYANVLNDLYERSKGAVLEPNDLIATEKATCKLSELLQERGYQYSGQLYLPTTTLKDQKVTKLTLSRECIFVDDFSNERRLGKFVGPILPLRYKNKGENQRVNEMLVTYLPKEIAPRKIGECVKEILNEPKDMAIVSNNHSGMALKKRLQNRTFQASFKRLLSHEHDVPDELLNYTDKLFKSVGFSVLKSLKTHFVYKGIKIVDSDDKKDFFMETENEKLQLYFASSTGLDTDVMYKAFAYMILKKLDHNMDGRITMLFPSLLEKPITELSEYLDKCDIKRHKSSPRMTVIFEPGERVIKEHICLLRQDVTEFSTHECIAVDVSGDEDYIYAKIIRKVSGDQQGERVYEVQVGEEEEAQELHETKLYKFDRGYEKITLQKMENIENNDDMRQIALKVEDNSSESIDDFTQDCLNKGYEQAVNEIRQILQTLPGKPEDIKKSSVRRLYLTWHPDKHSEATKGLATRVFQFLLKELKKNQETSQVVIQDKRWSEQAKEGRESTNQFYKNHRQQTSHQNSYGADKGGRNRSSCFTNAPPNYSNTNPQSAEGRRWMKQALCDLQTVIEVFNKNLKSYEWICFISHQAAEKAIKAAIFLNDYKELGGVHNLVTLATKYLSEDEPLGMKADNLERLVINTEKTKYPNFWNVPKIPNNSYTRQQASDAVDLANSIIQHIQNKYDAA